MMAAQLMQNEEDQPLHVSERMAAAIIARMEEKGECRIKLDAVNKTHATAIALSHGVIRLGPSPEMVIPLQSLLGLSKRTLDRGVAPRQPRLNS